MNTQSKPLAKARDSVTNRLLVYSQADTENFTLPKKMEWRPVQVGNGETYFLLKRIGSK